MSNDLFDLHPADPAAIARAGQIIRAGGLVAFPTETVYGLGADATND
ncbi:MAG TPA: Sua5/YciO/YrdC/YwlC family protein, partial [Rhizomicrobium sp.]|nr:Sua5/YciO/YrdC/YwlC family protein [Rhizomicrobium sp.]